MARRRYREEDDIDDFYGDANDDDAEPVNMFMNPFAAVDDIYEDPHVAPPPTPQVTSGAIDNTINRPSYIVTDAVSYYNQGALLVLLFAHVTEGISIPAIFDGAKQQMVTREVKFNF